MIKRPYHNTSYCNIRIYIIKYINIFFTIYRNTIKRILWNILDTSAMAVYFELFLLLGRSQWPTTIISFELSTNLFIVEKTPFRKHYFNDFFYRVIRSAKKCFHCARTYDNWNTKLNFAFLIIIITVYNNFARRCLNIINLWVTTFNFFLNRNILLQTLFFGRYFFDDFSIGFLFGLRLPYTLITFTSNQLLFINSKTSLFV